ncbi:MAG: ABC transporter ATP-binding protein [Gammaproteobacteria bacterium]|jgi:ABC-2 type transport system ATP-binding protein
MAEPFVVAEHLGKSFDDKAVIDDVSFEIEAGDVVGVLGKNGAGKTTLLELMLGFTPTTSGKVAVFGHESYRLPGTAKSRVGFVPQQDELIEQLSVADQLRMTRSFYSDWDDSLIDRLVGAWEIDLGERVRQLSIGQRQKLSILQALGHRPDLLMLDEPVASLDPVARRRFLEQIVEIASGGDRAVVFSSHIVSDIERLATKIWILKDRKLYWRGDFDELKESVVRLHLRGQGAIPNGTAIPNTLHVDAGEGYATVIVHDWTESLQSEIAELTRTKVEVERLTLEDIFLELHR